MDNVTSTIDDPAVDGATFPKYEDAALHSRRIDYLLRAGLFFAALMYLGRIKGSVNITW